MSVYGTYTPPEIGDDEIVTIYNAFRHRHSERDERMARIDAVVRGEFDVLDPNGDDVESKSPNLIQVALEDTAESASLIPTIRVAPHRAGKTAKRQAALQERIGAGYLDYAGLDILLPETITDLAAFGFAAWIVWPDFGDRLPLIEKLDPRLVYPDPAVRNGRELRRCMITRKVRLGQLPEEYQERLADFAGGNEASAVWQEEHDLVHLVELWDTERYDCWALFEVALSHFTERAEYHPVHLDGYRHGLGTCPVIYEQRPTLDKEARGQFDQVVDPFEAHIRLMSLVLDYADQAVYSDIWVKDLIGELSYGGGAFIELGPNGGIGRVPPAVNSLNVQQDIERLIDAIHLGARWPKSRPGEVDQSIASAKFIEAAAGMMNTALRTYHQLMKRMIERALRVAFLVDQTYFPGRKTISGVLRNQEFVEEYDPATDISLKNRVRVEYGLGLGRDPGQSAILMLQYAQNEYISHDFVQENIEGVNDVERERRRIDVKKFKDMAFAKLMQGLEAGTIPDRALVEIAQAREDGEEIFDLFRKYVVEPQEAQPFAGVPPVPGAGPPGAMPPVAPGAPGPEGAGAGPLPPAPPDPVQMLARLNVPAGPGATLGAQILSGG